MQRHREQKEEINFLEVKISKMKKKFGKKIYCSITNKKCSFPTGPWMQPWHDCYGQNQAFSHCMVSLLHRGNSYLIVYT